MSRKIKVNHKNQPILDVLNGFGLNRDRTPDSGWGELRSTNMELGSISEVELTEELLYILIEDLAYAYGQDSYKFRIKLMEFKIINYGN